MCAIIDANVVKDLFKDVGTAGKFFLSQVEDGKIKVAHRKLAGSDGGEEFPVGFSGV